jgi:hypothetical protein
MKKRYIVASILAGFGVVGALKVATDDRSVDQLCDEFKTKHGGAVQAALKTKPSYKIEGKRHGVVGETFSCEYTPKDFE